MLPLQSGHSPVHHVRVRHLSGSTETLSGPDLLPSRQEAQHATCSLWMGLEHSRIRQFNHHEVNEKSNDAFFRIASSIRDGAKPSISASSRAHKAQKPFLSRSPFREGQNWWSETEDAIRVLALRRRQFLAYWAVRLPLPCHPLL